LTRLPPALSHFSLHLEHFPTEQDVESSAFANSCEGDSVGLQYGYSDFVRHGRTTLGNRESRSMIEADFVIWKDCYSVNDLSLDDEHQRIFADINKLYLPMQGHAPGLAAERLLDELIHAARIHCQHEEDRMTEIVFGGFEAHKTLHRDILQWMTSLKSQLAACVAYDSMQFIKNWWLDHILNEDKKYAAFIDGVRVWSDEHLNK
jgi:hemerythrin-like metal-binding protein